MQIRLSMNIPIYSANGHLLHWAPEEGVLENARHFTLVRNRRGHLKRAVLKPADLSLDLRPTSSVGLAFRQPLSAGSCYALHGVAGSGESDVIVRVANEHGRSEMVGC
jgi:hypothetical protein